jgi:hypothetical protein
MRTGRGSYRRCRAVRDEADALRDKAKKTDLNGIVNRSCEIGREFEPVADQALLRRKRMTVLFGF